MGKIVYDIVLHSCFSTHTYTHTHAHTRAHTHTHARDLVSKTTIEVNETVDDLCLASKSSKKRGTQQH